MQINLIYDQPMNTLPAGFTDAMNRVVAYLDAEFTNNVTLNRSNHPAPASARSQHNRPHDIPIA
jgi:hypothetical protein